LAFVAEQDGEIVGMVLFSRAFVDAADRLVDVLVLSPVGVRRDRQDRGIGQRLVTDALSALQSRPEPLVFLEGIPSYYPRFGFRPAGEMGFTAPSVRIPAAAFMAYPLPAYDPSLRGALVYPDAFWRADAVGLRG
jgi:putative acetyltransferase